MTLTTTVRIYDPTPLEPLWSFVRELVGSTDDTEWRERVVSYDPAMRSRFNLSGQGCHALLSLRFSPDGFLPVDEEDYRSEPCMYEVDFDVPYGEAQNFNAWAVRTLTHWLDDRRIKWQWWDDFACTWHDSLEKLAQRVGDPDLGEPVASRSGE